MLFFCEDQRLISKFLEVRILKYRLLEHRRWAVPVVKEGDDACLGLLRFDLVDFMILVKRSSLPRGLSCALISVWGQQSLVCVGSGEEQC